MNSKFLRKVSDTEGLPSYIEKTFVGSSTEDPYAHLRAAYQENQIKIAKQQRGLNRDASLKSEDRDWERIQGASVYQERRAMSIDDRLAQMEAEDFSPHSVRRSGYGVDAGDTVREVTSSLKAFSPEDYMNVMLRGAASIWEPDMYAIAEAFMESQENESQQAIIDAQQRRMARKNRHDDWEREKSQQISSLRKPTVLASRAGTILRTAIENEAAGNFGMIDFDALDEREAQRIAMQNAQREQRLALKGKHLKDRNQRHNEWENNVAVRARTAAEIYNYVNIQTDDEE
jgi:hypothetical protein